MFVLKNLIFSLFPMVKMNANYTEICRVGNLEADFQQVPFVQFCSIFLKLDKNSKKSLYYRILILGYQYIFENKT